jgi:5-formyltetrahydrofolate cyclo-ligase
MKARWRKLACVAVVPRDPERGQRANLLSWPEEASRKRAYVARGSRGAACVVARRAMEIDAEMELTLRYRAKAVLRKRARALRSTIPAPAIAARSTQIREALSELDAFAAAKAIALFYPIEGRQEVDLRPLDAELRARGARVAYPSIDPETRVMTFRFVADPEAMEERGLGFREPSDEDAEAAVLDVVIVPALQIDPRGYRIGYGAGFYDRTLPRFCPPARKIGVAFDFQLVPEVPTTDGDVPLEVIVTDTRVLAVTPT